MIADKEMPQDQMREQGQEEPGEQARDQQKPDGYDEVMRVALAAMKVLYDKATSDGVVQMLTKTGDPMSALVQTSMFVLRILFDQSKSSIPPKILIAASVPVVSLLAELGTAAGVPMLEIEDQAKKVVAQQLQQKLSQQQSQVEQPMPAGAHTMPDGATMGQPTKRPGIINAGMSA